MKKYKVVWEVSKVAYIEAENEEEAINQAMEGKVEGQEDEITGQPIAFERL